MSKVSATRGDRARAGDPDTGTPEARQGFGAGSRARKRRSPASQLTMAMVECAPGGAEGELDEDPGVRGDPVAAPPPAPSAPPAEAPAARAAVVSPAPAVTRRLTFEELYLSSYQSLVRLAFVLTGSRELSEDLVQDCFVRLHRRFDQVESPEGYARQSVVNACRSHFRKAGRERDRRPLLYLVEGGSGASSGELHDVLLALPYRQRAAIVLRYYADLSEAEIAVALGCRPGTVGSLLHRGLERLREVVER